MGSGEIVLGLERLRMLLQLPDEWQIDAVLADPHAETVTLRLSTKDLPVRERTWQDMPSRWPLTLNWERRTSESDGKVWQWTRVERVPE